MPPLATTMLTLAFVMTKGGQAITSILVVYPDLYAVPLLPHLDPNQSQSEVSGALSRSKAVLGVPSGAMIDHGQRSSIPLLLPHC
jgi:hypothetical protein